MDDLTSPTPKMVKTEPEDPLDTLRVLVNNLLGFTMASLSPGSHDVLGQLDDFVLFALRQQVEALSLSIALSASATVQPQPQTLSQPLGREKEVQVLEALNLLMGIARENFYKYSGNQVPEKWRRLYTEAGCLKAATLLRGLLEGGGEGIEKLERRLDAIVYTLDHVLIIASAPGPRRREWITSVLTSLETLVNRLGQHDDPAPSNITSWRDMTSFSPSHAFIPLTHRPIRAITNISFEDFQLHLLKPSALGPDPLVLRGVINHWPAIKDRTWAGPKQLLEKTFGGRRYVPVELGRSYVDEGWNQDVLRFDDFLEKHIIQPTRNAHEERQKREGPCCNIAASRYSEVLAKSADEDVELTSLTKVTRTLTLPPSKLDSTGSSLPIRPSEPASQAVPTTYNGWTILPFPPSTTSPPSSSPNTTGYLAQHSLFIQLPSLRQDILTPDLCYTTPPPAPASSSILPVPELEKPLVNAWFGPAGTITPLHTDPYHNILAQVVGAKYVRLYPPGSIEKWQRERRERDENEKDDDNEKGKEKEKGLNNTCLVDVGKFEGWDSIASLSPSFEVGDPQLVDMLRSDAELIGPDGRRLEKGHLAKRKAVEGYRDEYRGLEELEYVETVLREGESLYLPVGWWHYVRGVEVSFSVSFWWN